jgi:mono/diheme cytochrome c family protein
MKNLVPSIAATPNSIREGDYLYQIYCAMCHGEKGQGDGAVSKKYYPKLADLSSARVQQLADKEIFTRITNGFRTMPSFKKDLAPQERWHIINYLRTLGQG